MGEFRRASRRRAAGRQRRGVPRVTRKLELKLDRKGRPRFVGALSPKEVEELTDDPDKTWVPVVMKLKLLMDHYREQDPDKAPAPEEVRAWLWLAEMLARDFVRGFGPGK